jgi:O-antigen ligase
MIFHVFFVFITSYFIYAAFINSSACECRNITLQCRNDFDKLLMWNLNDDVVFISSSVAFLLKTIINAVWNTKIFFIFSLIQVVFAKSFEDFRTRFSWTMLATFIRKLIFFDVNTFSEAFSVSKNSFDSFDEFEQRKSFFREEILFSLFNDWFFREKLIISLFEVSFRERNLVRMMILKQSKRRRTLFRRRKFDVLIRSI